MLLLFKAGTAVLCGVLGAMAVYFVSLLFVRLFSRVMRVKASFSATGLSGCFRTTLVSLRKDPFSRAARHARLGIAFIVLLLSLAASGKIIFALLAAVATFYGTGRYLQLQREKARALFEEQLIEAIGTITGSVRSGQSLFQALEQTVKSSKPPLSDAFAGVLNEVALGTPLDQALRSLSQKIRSSDLRLLVTSLNVARETGGNIGEMLTRLASTMRERRKLQGRIAALTAQGKASGLVMSFAPFVLLIALYAMEPATFGLLFTTVAGNILLTVAVIMVGCGGMLINRLVKIDI
jgi:tight adherence protein B